MTTETNDLLVETLDRRVQRRESRRELFLRGAIAAAGAGMALSATSAAAQSSTPTDADVLNFALNLEYLEAQFYLFAVNGSGLPASALTGTGTQGQATGGRRVNFTDPVVAQYAREIAADEAAHVTFLRSALGTSAVAQPEIDIGTAPSGAFSSAARAAGLVGANQSFDPYASDEYFLLGAFIFEDVGVTAYKGAAPLLTSKTFLEAAAGIMAAEAYHAALIRTVLYAKGVATPSLRNATVSISNARDSLDGTSDLDQGVIGTSDMSNIVPADANAVAFSRTTGQVLNIAYLTAQARDRGGFFPNGVNGTIRSSTA